MRAPALGPLSLQLRLTLSRCRGGLAAGALCLAGLLAWLWWIPQQHASLERQQATLVTQRAAVARLPAVPAAPMPSQASARIEQFQRTLGDPRELNSHLQTIFGLAQEAGLTLAKGEYKTELNRPSRTVAYRIFLPVAGPYANIRRFSERVMETLPFACLDEISVRRETIGAGLPSVRLRLTLYLTDAPAAPSAPKLLTLQEVTP